MSNPELSVVMSVFNGVESLDRTIRSVLSQEGVDIEFIIVNDGSTDGSTELLRKMRDSDPRVLLTEQSNKGLTQALITGCAQARGDFIARQDVGDISLANRFKTQLETLRDNPEIAMVSSAVTFVAPDGEDFNTVVLDEADATEGLKKLDLNGIKGPPHHGSVMFRRDIYQETGGYRKEFTVAQDIDLWTRMIEYGRHISLREVLYSAALCKNSISASQRELQIENAEFIFKCCRARHKTGCDESVLEELRTRSISLKTHSICTAKSDSKFYYFLGSGLFSKNQRASTKYLKRSVQLNPFDWKARIRLAILKWHEKT